MLGFPFATVPVALPGFDWMPAFGSVPVWPPVVVVVAGENRKYKPIPTMMARRTIGRMRMNFLIGKNALGLY